MSETRFRRRGHISRIVLLTCAIVSALALTLVPTIKTALADPPIGNLPGSPTYLCCEFSEAFPEQSKCAKCWSWEGCLAGEVVGYDADGTPVGTVVIASCRARQ